MALRLVCKSLYHSTLQHFMYSPPMSRDLHSYNDCYKPDFCDNAKFYLDAVVLVTFCESFGVAE